MTTMMRMAMTKTRMTITRKRRMRMAMTKTMTTMMTTTTRRKTDPKRGRREERETWPKPANNKSASNNESHFLLEAQLESLHLKTTLLSPPPLADRAPKIVRNALFYIKTNEIAFMIFAFFVPQIS